jgi:hypothetical protein
MAITYEPIATTTLGTTTASVTFSTISGAYTDLVLVINGTVTAGVAVTLQFNGDTGSNYSQTNLYGDGSSVGSGAQTSIAFAPAGSLGTTQSNTIIQIMNYSNTTTYKTVLSRGSNTTGFAIARVNLWRDTSAITSIVCDLTSGADYNSGTILTLYGIKAA